MASPLQPFARRLGVLLLIVVGLLVLHFLTHEVLLLFAAILLAILWRNVAGWISARTGLGAGWALLLVIVVQYGVFVGAGFLLAPRVSAQITALSGSLPQVISDLEHSVRSSEVGRMLWRQLPDQQELFRNSTQLVARVVNFFTLTLSALLDVVIVSVLAIFLATNPLLYVQGLLRLIPPTRRPRAAQILETLNVTLFRWFVGKILDMTTVGIMTAIGLWALGMPLVLTFSLLAFLLSFVPNVGPVLSAVPPILLAFVDSPRMALWVVLLYLGIQTFESYFITPAIQRHAIKMPPVLLLAIQLIFAKIVGALGLLLSTPILATVIVLVRMLYIEDTLGDKQVASDQEVRARRQSGRLLPDAPDGPPQP